MIWSGGKARPVEHRQQTDGGVRLAAVVGTERGSVLLLVAFLAVLLGVLSLSLLSLMTADTEEIYNHLHSTRALTVAEAGIEHAVKMLRNDPNWNTGFAEYTFPSGSDDSYSVTVDNAAYPSVVLVSTSAVEGFSRRVQVAVIVDGPPESTPYPVRIAAWNEL